MLQGLSKFGQEMPKDPADRGFNGLKRGPDGKYNDDDLVEIITSSIEDVAGMQSLRPCKHIFHTLLWL